jgi:malonyl CoA-acyl carrier protein transacylase
VLSVIINCDGQIVVSGDKTELDAFRQMVKDKNGKALPLKVSGGFHSPFMAEASAEFQKLRNTACRPENSRLFQCDSVALSRKCQDTCSTADVFPRFVEANHCKHGGAGIDM